MTSLYQLATQLSLKLSNIPHFIPVSDESCHHSRSYQATLSPQMDYLDYKLPVPQLDPTPSNFL